MFEKNFDFLVIGLDLVVVASDAEECSLKSQLET
jgi:hypothetical protein